MLDKQGHVEAASQALHDDLIAYADDAAAVALSAHEAVELWDAARPELVRRRRAALRELITEGWTYDEIGNLLTVPRRHVRHLLYGRKGSHDHA